MENYHTVINSVLSTPQINIKVACLKEDPSVILGYAVLAATPNALHWVFIKKSWRNIGLAKDLISKNVNVATHLTKTGLSIIKKKDWQFNPFLL